MSLNPSIGSIVQGSSNSTGIVVTTVSGNTQSVGLSCPVVIPAGVSCLLSPASTNSTSMLTVSTSLSTPLGTNSITIKGSGNNVTRTVNYTFTIFTNSMSTPTATPTLTSAANVTPTTTSSTSPTLTATPAPTIIQAASSPTQTPPVATVTPILSLPATPPTQTPETVQTSEGAIRAIKYANDNLNFVDQQIATAQMQNLPVQEAIDTVTEAKNLVKRAQLEFSAGNYGNAVDLSAQATTLATSSLQSIPKPGQLPTAKLAIAAVVIILIVSVIYLKFIRKPPKPAYRPRPQYYPHSVKQF